MSTNLVDEDEADAAVRFTTDLIQFCWRTADNPRLACFGLMQALVTLSVSARVPGVMIADVKEAALEEVARYFDSAIAWKAKEL